MSTSPTPASSASAARAGRVPRYVTISAWSIPVLIIGQFAMLAIVPVAAVTFGALRTAQLRSVRWWAVLLNALYATALAIWLLRPDGARSLSRDMHPVFPVLIVAASALVLLTIYRRKR